MQTRGFFVGVISGHISVNALDGTYLGISLINLLGHLPMLGVTSAIDYLGMRALADPSTQREVSFLLIKFFLLQLSWLNELYTCLRLPLGLLSLNVQTTK